MINIQITEKELLAITELIDSAESMVGCQDDEGEEGFDKEVKTASKAIKQVLKRNRFYWDAEKTHCSLCGCAIIGCDPDEKEKVCERCMSEAIDYEL